LPGALEAAPFATPWQRYLSRTVSPPPKTEAGVAAGAPAICACSAFAYSSAPCQEAAKAHCLAGKGMGGSGFCKAILGLGLKKLSADPGGLAAIATYLHEECFYNDSIEVEDPDFCPCFKVGQRARRARPPPAAREAAPGRLCGPGTEGTAARGRVQQTEGAACPAARGAAVTLL
jgi:hypothetical protein